MNNKIRQLIMVLGIMFVIGAATAITIQEVFISQINQTNGENFTKAVMPLDYVINSTAGTWKQNANRSIELTATLNITNGTYIGDNTQNRAIPHGLYRIPKVIFLQEDITATPNFWINIDGRHFYEINAQVPRTVTAADATNFYVGIATPFNTNIVTRQYNWTAI